MLRLKRPQPLSRLFELLAPHECFATRVSESTLGVAKALRLTLNLVGLSPNQGAGLRATRLQSGNVGTRGNHRFPLGFRLLSLAVPSFHNLEVRDELVDDIEAEK